MSTLSKIKISVMEFITTTRGGRKLLYKGYAYVMNREAGKYAYWRCDKRKLCKASLKTKNDVLEGSITAHTHNPDPARVTALKTVDEIKKRARASDECTSSVIQNSTTHFPLSAAGALPKKESLARLVRRQRSAPDGDVLCDELKVTTRGEPFLAFEDSDLQIVIMTTDQNLDILASRPHWFCDGTFDSAPDGFQLYTIHAMLNQSRTVPLVYCITKHKHEATYNAIWHFLKLERNLNPESIMLDFERAALNSIQKHFPHCHINGCLFHFGQCIWRKIQSDGLVNWYTESLENALLIKSLQALAFVPVPDVSDAFHRFVCSIDEETDEMISSILTYFEATWIGIVQRGRRRRPAFPQELWNVHDRVLDNLPRTNNSVEGWHRAFDLRVRITHPTLCRLVDRLRKEQADNELVIEHVKAGVALPQTKKKYEQVNARLKNIVSNYHVTPILDYLKGVAHNL